jgi:hypothetical protein
VATQLPSTTTTSIPVNALTAIQLLECFRNIQVLLNALVQGHFRKDMGWNFLFPPQMDIMISASKFAH